MMSETMSNPGGIDESTFQCLDLEDLVSTFKVLAAACANDTNDGVSESWTNHVFFSFVSYILANEAVLDKVRMSANITLKRAFENITGRAPRGAISTDRPDFAAFSPKGAVWMVAELKPPHKSDKKDISEYALYEAGFVQVQKGVSEAFRINNANFRDGWDIDLVAGIVSDGFRYRCLLYKDDEQGGIRAVKDFGFKEVFTGGGMRHPALSINWEEYKEVSGFIYTACTGLWNSEAVGFTGMELEVRRELELLLTNPDLHKKALLAFRDRHALQQCGLTNNVFKVNGKLSFSMLCLKLAGHFGCDVPARLRQRLEPSRVAAASRRTASVLSATSPAGSCAGGTSAASASTASTTTATSTMTARTRTAVPQPGQLVVQATAPVGNARQKLGLVGQTITVETLRAALEAFKAEKGYSSWELVGQELNLTYSKSRNYRDRVDRMAIQTVVDELNAM